MNEVGAQLRRAGLTEAALLAWAGTHRLSALPLVAPALAARPVVPASTALGLFVAGAELALDHARALPIDRLVAAGLIEVAGDRVRATVAILPLEQTLLVCDRFDAPDTRERVCWPDDSSYHLASAIARGRRARWVDLATGSAFAPLARPALATAIAGSDLNPRAVAFATLGTELSGCRHVTIHAGDVGDADVTGADLVTCNAPIPEDAGAAIWRSTDRGFFARLWALRPEGEVVVHCTLDAVPDELPGEVCSVVYTPPGERAFAITWWSPARPARRVVGQRVLTPTRPHVDPRDRDDVLAAAR